MPDQTSGHPPEGAPDAVSDAADGGFTARIGELIQKFGNISRIAQMCGFSEGAVRSWRDGRSDPSRSRCLTLAGSLGISLAWLMTGEGNMMEDKRAPSPVTAPATTATPSMDARLLSSAIGVLQATLKSTGNELSVEDRADLLVQYYNALANPDPVARAEGLSEVHRHFVERVRHTKSSA